VNASRFLRVDGLVVLERRLLKVVYGLGNGVSGGLAVDCRGLLSGLADGVGSTIGTLVLFSLQALDLLLGLRNVLQVVLAEPNAYKEKVAPLQ
jgi:hypothetical protein